MAFLRGRTTQGPRVGLAGQGGPGEAKRTTNEVNRPEEPTPIGVRLVRWYEPGGECFP